MTRQWIQLEDENGDEIWLPIELEETEGTYVNIGWRWITAILIAWALAGLLMIWFIWAVLG